MEIDVERPVAPGSVAGTGLEIGVLTDLALKTLYVASNIEGFEIAKRLGLSMTITTDVLQYLKRERLCEVTGGTGRSEGTLRYVLTSAGIERA